MYVSPAQRQRDSGVPATRSSRSARCKPSCFLDHLDGAVRIRPAFLAYLANQGVPLLPATLRVWSSRVNRPSAAPQGLAPSICENFAMKWSLYLLSAPRLRRIPPRRRRQARGGARRSYNLPMENGGVAHRREEMSPQASHAPRRQLFPRHTGDLRGFDMMFEEEREKEATAADTAVATGVIRATTRLGILKLLTMIKVSRAASLAETQQERELCS